MQSSNHYIYWTDLDDTTLVSGWNGCCSTDVHVACGYLTVRSLCYSEPEYQDGEEFELRTSRRNPPLFGNCSASHRI